ncbi:MAG: helix-turn-helix domain-containing protein [Thermodesulfovibrionales bacterium]
MKIKEGTNMDLLLTPREVAQMLRVSTRTVYYYSNCGLLPVVKLIRSLRFRRQDVEDFISKRLLKGNQDDIEQVIRNIREKLARP